MPRSGMEVATVRLRGRGAQRAPRRGHGRGAVTVKALRVNDKRGDAELVSANGFPSAILPAWARNHPVRRSSTNPPQVVRRIYREYLSDRGDRAIALGVLPSISFVYV
ncbi:hypothetical protein ACQPZ2_21850 [Nocardia pseudovaccinii]|uniref:hypothetical protein n=1 Tax=Nocardia pseudovaccinii TaxID=189540 RepID=UPI003D908E76